MDAVEIPKNHNVHSPPSNAPGLAATTGRLLLSALVVGGTWSVGMGASAISFSGSELLGNPTDTSITINVVPQASVYTYFEYGTVSGGPYTATTPMLTAANEPHEIVLSELTPDTQYYYRMRYAQTESDPTYVARPQYSFHTARSVGSTYQFVITSDSHVHIALGSESEWQTALDLIAADAPDFLIDLGDTFAMDNGSMGVTSAAAADVVYLYQRGPTMLGRASHSVPMFFAMGNHENEEGWNFDDTNPQPIFSMIARKRYFPLPSPLTDPSFYSANTDPVAAGDVTPPNSPILGGDQYREDYYAWTWGDALFVVFDPFQYTMQNPYGASAGESNDDPAVGDRWNWTLGLQQHLWLQNVLSTSTAKYKFLLAHHMVGGTQNYVRGGAEPAHQYEWGGYESNGTTYGFTTRRPPGDGWIAPIRQMMIDYDVTAFFHGHDHQFVYELRDGIVYQEVPAASQGTGAGFGSYNSSPYVQRMENNSGYLRLTISPVQALVEYVKSTGANVGSVQYSYTMAPNVEPDFTITASAGSHGSISPSGAVGVMAAADQNFTITPSTGYEVAEVIVDGGSVGPMPSFNFPNVSSNHTISATFAATAASGEVAVDGAVSSGSGAANATSVGFSHTTGSGADRLLLVGVSWNSNNSEQNVSSVVFSSNGGASTLPLTLVFDQQSSGNPRNASIYRLLNPPAGEAGTVTVTFGGQVASGIVAGAVNFAGVDQTTPLGTPGGATGSSATPSVTLNGLSGDELVFDTVFKGASSSGTAFNGGSDQAEQWNLFSVNTRGGGSVEPAAGSSVTMSWSSGTSSSVWAIAAVPINPSPVVVTTYDLTMAVGVGGGGTVTPAAGISTYPENEVVDLTATPAFGYAFQNWTGPVADPNAATTTVTMDADKSVMANFVPVAPGTVAMDGASSSAADDDVSSISFAHTIGTGTDRLLLVGVSWNSNSTERDITSVEFSYGVVPTVLPLSLVIDQPGAAQPRNAAIYSLVNPPSGASGTVTVNFSGSVASGIVAGATNFAGVDQLNPLGPPAGATATSSAAPSLTLTGLNGVELVFDTVFQGAADSGQTLSVGADQTEQWNDFAGNTRAAASVEQATGSSVTMSWSAASTGTWALAAVPIHPAGAVELTVEVSGDGSTDPAAGVHNYGVNTMANISAIPDVGRFFDGWIGAVTDSTAMSTTVLMDGDKTVIASFVTAPAGAITFLGDAGSGSIKDDTNNSLVIDLDAGVAAGDTIIIGYVSSPNPDLVVTVTDTQGNTYEQAEMSRSFEDGRTFMFYAYVDNALADTDSITIAQAVTADPVPDSRAAVVSVFRGLTRNGLDQMLGNHPFEDEAQASGTNPHVGPTGTTMQAHELVFAVIGTNGPVEDAAGTWDYGFGAGERLGTTGGTPESNWTVSVGWQWVSFTGEYSAAKTGVTDRQWASVIATFKAYDTDADGISDDVEETTSGLDPFDPTDALLDFDGDGSNNVSEHVAGTDMFDPASLLKITIAVVGDNAEITIPGPLVVAGKTYFLDYRETLSDPWSQVDSFIPGASGSDHTFVHDISDNATAFFQVRVIPASP